MNLLATICLTFCVLHGDEIVESIMSGVVAKPGSKLDCAGEQQARTPEFFYAQLNHLDKVVALLEPLLAAHKELHEQIRKIHDVQNDLHKWQETRLKVNDKPASDPHTINAAIRAINCLIGIRTRLPHNSRCGREVRYEMKSIIHNLTWYVYYLHDSVAKPTHPPLLQFKELEPESIQRAFDDVCRVLDDFAHSASYTGHKQTKAVQVFLDAKKTIKGNLLIH